MSRRSKIMEKYYPQPWNIKGYDEDVLDRVHNALKHGMEPEKFKPYYKWHLSKWFKRMGDKK